MSSKRLIANPYLEEFMQFVGKDFDYRSYDAWYSDELLHEEVPGDIFTTKHFRSHSMRMDLIPRYSFAIPCDEAIQAIAELSPIIEIGAGTGYWASMLSQAGADVIAYDDRSFKFSTPGAAFEFGKYFEVRDGNQSSAALHPDRTLFLCWPNYDSRFGVDCLLAYKGEHVCLVGEGHGGCTGNDEMFDVLEEQFDEIKTVDIPQWYGINDYLSISRRKTR